MVRILEFLCIELQIMKITMKNPIFHSTRKLVNITHVELLFLYVLFLIDFMSINSTIQLGQIVIVMRSFKTMIYIRDKAPSTHLKNRKYNDLILDDQFPMKSGILVQMICVEESKAKGHKLSETVQKSLRIKIKFNKKLYMLYMLITTDLSTIVLKYYTQIKLQKSTFLLNKILQFRLHISLCPKLYRSGINNELFLVTVNSDKYILSKQINILGHYLCTWRMSKTMKAYINKNTYSPVGKYFLFVKLFCSNTTEQWNLVWYCIMYNRDDFLYAACKKIYTK